MNGLFRAGFEVRSKQFVGCINLFEQLSLSMVFFLFFDVRMTVI